MSENAKIEKPKRVTVKSLRVQLERAHSDRTAAEVLLKRTAEQRDELDRQVREAKKMATAFRGLQLDWHASMNEGREKYLDGELGRTREKLAAAEKKIAELEQSPERQAITLYMLKNNELTRDRDRLREELAAVTDRAASQPLTGQAEPDCACNRCELIRARAERDRLLQQNDRLRAELDAAVEHFKRTSDERYRLKQQNDRQAETIEGLFGQINQAHKLATEGRGWLRYGFTPYATAKVESLLEQIRGLLSVCQPTPDGKPAETESEPLILVFRVNTR